MIRLRTSFGVSILAVMILFPCQAGVAGMGVAREFSIDSARFSALENVSSSLTLGDVDGDGETDFVLTNGAKLIKAYDFSGTLLFEDAGAGVSNYDQFHDTSTGGHHPWIAAAGDLDGDGREEVIHAWQFDGKTSRVWLVVRDGATGAIEHKRKLWFSPTTSNWQKRCMVAVAYQAQNVPVILVMDDDTGNELAAFSWDLSEQLWSVQTGRSGHYVWPYDFDGDGVHGHIFVGWKVYDAHGNLRYVLADFGSEHVDGLQAGDIDPTRPGFEVATVGQSGIRLHDAGTGALIWKIPTSQIADPQNIALGQFDPSIPGLELVVKQRPSEYDRRVYLIDHAGVIRKEIVGRGYMGTPLQNMDADGVRAVDELHVSDATVATAAWLQVQVASAWYRNRQTLSSVEQSYHPNWQWQPASRVMDILGDSREELIAFGLHKLVVGDHSTPLANPPQSLRDKRAYKLRSQAQTFVGRAGIYYNFQEADSETPTKAPNAPQNIQVH
jgi:hypothetical protein